ncbi:MAG: DUF2156 domain-containing protein [Clostridiales bacterium]|nr:DUF2156 domain-containing protein [Clostridiales bacterium]
MEEKSRSDELKRAYQIIRAYGDDSQNCLCLNDENSYFFGADICGVIPYKLSRRKAMSQGDPVCRPEDREKLVDEYLGFCRQNGCRPVFNSVGADTADLLRRKGLHVLKYGEEAILDLGSYSLSGGKKGALRRNTAKLNRAGVMLEEYYPETARDFTLEQEIAELEKQWFAGKKLKLTYSIGDLHFEEPFGRRYFITRDSEGRLQTVLSFLPYHRGRGYCIDVMYRRPDGLTGAMEQAIILAAFKMKDDGVEEVSLNIAPLAGIDITKPDTNRVERLMNAIFQNMDFGYDFKNLYRFKSKFSPSTWKMRYLAYDHRIPLANLAVSITNTKGVRNIRFYLRYARFFVSLFLYPERYRNHQSGH